jgi:molybdopterin-guanine dinucleotide biosynthesis protein B
MIPIISVVGKSGSGKTKFLTKLVPELKKRGYKVAVIKHDVHSRIDLPNKDTWQISKAGAKPVLIAGPKKMAVLRDLDKEKNLDDLAEYCSDVDLILTEGYKKENKPKIEVYSQGSLLSAENELLAVVSAKRINCSVPQFRFKEMKKVVELIEKKYLLGKKSKKDVKLIVNGQKIPLNFFVKGFISSTIVGMIKSLKRLPKKFGEVELKIYS